MNTTNVMNTNDAPVAKYAQVFVTLKNKRYAMLMCKNFEAKASISNQDVPRMGSIIMGKKPTSVEISFIYSFSESKVYLYSLGCVVDKDKGLANAMVGKAPIS